MLARRLARSAAVPSGTITRALGTPRGSAMRASTNARYDCGCPAGSPTYSSSATSERPSVTRPRSRCRRASSA
ncbi:hypothetical protein BC477_09325 [Clavibacter michiganensis subsp. michiganensis]|uniref:Uncharacterized protein n=1 Tax=Clavibacter michiganensis subsp. michiganensis TaxID=33013 RepID=A0A251XN82_CLAMM|nr:hypothetical protein BC477_09325 [Clavibacter michiganensis subsp. michiganensis]OUE04925.1 hypothetical protein CMMCAS07_08245 [Clavibacter michiganensis subsp. michiganensis]